MNRREELDQLVGEETATIGKTLDEIVFLEEKLEELKKLPFIEVHPKNKMKQRNTPAAKMYKEFLQQYINCIKLVENVIYRGKKLDNKEVEESPLREWFKNHGSNVMNDNITRKEDMDTG